MIVSEILSVHRDGTENGALLTLAGEIDLSSAPVLREHLARCIHEGALTVDIDLTGVTFCDCAGLGIMIDARRRLAGGGGVLRLHHPRPAVARLLVATGTAGRLLADRAKAPAPEKGQPEKWEPEKWEPGLAAEA